MKKKPTKKPTKKPSKKPSKKAETYYKIIGSPNTMSAFKQMLGYPV